MNNSTQTFSAPPLPSQRWVSDSEPELGLGVILDANRRMVEILFAASGERRLYALATAPLRRVVFKVGDRIKDGEGNEVTVERVSEEEGLLTYHAGGRAIPEAELSDAISFSSPEERLMAGTLDPIELFDLRVETLDMAGKIAASPVRGFVGPRVDLIPHQMSIAGEVASRLTPRVLLADEVGLGKTIEAGLILHRLHLSGRADRVLILVPDPLIHQWFVELYRRFNMQVTILDEKRIEGIEEEDPEANPFLSAQFVLCSVDLVADDEKRTAQALEAGWDLLIVDEAHHLEWSPEEPSPAYEAVAAFAEATPGLLLLTATPQQLGAEGHFARLHLLDPSRYRRLKRFTKEAEEYEKVAEVVDRVVNREPLRTEDIFFIDAHAKEIGEHARELPANDPVARERLVAELLDSFGPGRVMFRNTRAAIPGFPERKADLIPLEGEDEVEAKIDWLAGFLREDESRKVLLICRSRELAESIDERLQEVIQVKAALFHEEVPLLRRDRNAAWFAEEDGARILISSEIGSEGRNFQFAHDLVLFDLPTNPELLEQRIGRLDRIGQSATINVHVPYLVGTDGEVLARWYHEGLDAFERSLHGATEIVRDLQDALAPLLEKYDEKKLKALIAESIEEKERVTGRLQRGYDRLLQLNSNRPGRSAETIEAIRASGDDRTLEEFFLRLLDYFGVTVEEIAERTYILRPGHLLTDAFPPIPADGLAVTFDRDRALVREDLQFFSIDHPFVRDVLGLFLGSEQGNATLAVWKEMEDEQVYLEMIVVVETVADEGLDTERYLPPRPLRIVVNQAKRPRHKDTALQNATLLDGTRLGMKIDDLPTAYLLPELIDAALRRAQKKTAELAREATERVREDLSAEIDRLSWLARINKDVSSDEILKMTERRNGLVAALAGARPRVVALRVIVGEEEGEAEAEETAGEG